MVAFDSAVNMNRMSYGRKMFTPFFSDSPFSLGALLIPGGSWWSGAAALWELSRIGVEQINKQERMSRFNGHTHAHANCGGFTVDS